MRRIALATFLLVAIGPVIQACEPSPIDYAIRLVGTSLWFTDYLQSRPILHCTKDQPCSINGASVWEGNPTLAGSGPVTFKRHMHAANAMRDGTVCSFGTPARLAALALLVRHTVVVHNNNEALDQIGLGPAFGVGWTWYF